MKSKKINLPHELESFRESTKRNRKIAFKNEQKLCIDRLRLMMDIVKLGDVDEMKDMHDLIGVCLDYLTANDPRKEKNAINECRVKDWKKFQL